MTTFNKKIAKEIAERSFGYTLDCILGYSDSNYDIGTPASVFEQNFEEDLEEKGITITTRRVKMCCDSYNEMVKKFELMVRKKYYDKPIKTK